MSAPPAGCYSFRPKFEPRRKEDRLRGGTIFIGRTCRMRCGAPPGAEQWRGIARADSQPADFVSVKGGAGPIRPFPRRESQAVAGTGGERLGLGRVRARPAVRICQRGHFAAEASLQDAFRFSQLVIVGNRRRAGPAVDGCARASRSSGPRSSRPVAGPVPRS